MAKHLYNVGDILILHYYRPSKNTNEEFYIVKILGRESYLSYRIKILVKIKDAISIKDRQLIGQAWLARFEHKSGPYKEVEEYIESRPFSLKSFILRQVF